MFHRNFTLCWISNIENDKRNIEQDKGKEEKNITKRNQFLYHNSHYIYIQKEFISLLWNPYINIRVESLRTTILYVISPLYFHTFIWNNSSHSSFSISCINCALFLPWNADSRRARNLKVATAVRQALCPPTPRTIHPARWNFSAPDSPSSRASRSDYGTRRRSRASCSLICSANRKRQCVAATYPSGQIDNCLERSLNVPS